MPFTPKDGTPQWQVVYRLFRQAPVGEVITFQQLAEALGLDPAADRNRIRAPARRAIQQMLRADDRAVETVRGQGYRIVTAEQQIPIAGAQIERAAQALDHGRDLTTHIRLAELSPESLSIVQTMAAGFAQVAEYARQITRRVDNHEGRLAVVETELRRIQQARTVQFHPAELPTAVAAPVPALSGSQQPPFAWASPGQIPPLRDPE
jgi:alkylated DNA nucleotide flippase Atl1